MPVFAADEVVTAAKMNEIAKGVLGYAQATASQNGISAITDITSCSVTVDVSSSARRIYITGQVNYRQRTAPGTPVITVYEGSTFLGRIGSHTLSNDEFALATGYVLLTPTSGSHTYKLRAATTAGTVDLPADTTAFGPNSITVIDLGAV